VERYKARLDKLSGIGFQKITPNSRSTFKDLSIFVDRERFGMSRDILCKALEKENIATKKYFFPPLHRQRAYSHLFRKYKDKLPVTNHVSENVLSMPLYSHMSGEYVDRICSAVERVYEWRGEIA
jgi:dTDP-4-amino-4,6-dideoxygalactose transaminase